MWAETDALPDNSWQHRPSFGDIFPLSTIAESRITSLRFGISLSDVSKT